NFQWEQGLVAAIAAAHTQQCKRARVGDKGDVLLIAQRSKPRPPRQALFQCFTEFPQWLLERKRPHFHRIKTIALTQDQRTGTCGVVAVGHDDGLAAERASPVIGEQDFLQTNAAPSRRVGVQKKDALTVGGHENQARAFLSRAPWSEASTELDESFLQPVVA